MVGHIGPTAQKARQNNKHSLIAIMAFPIKYLSLNKSELEYEVAIRGEDPAPTVVELRKQITRLAPSNPSDDIFTTQFDPSTELLTCFSLLERLKISLSADNIDKVSLSRVENNLHHLYHRLNRIEITDDLENNYEDCRKYFKELYSQTISLKQSSSDPLTPSKPNKEKHAEMQPLQVTVLCEGNNNHGNLSDLSKIKYDGKTCVRSFIQRVQEFSAARNVSDAKLLASATEIFTGEALHWYRSIRDSVSSWQDVLQLIKEFDKPDYDYRLLAEIRERTQGKTESITIYLAILIGMFSRLSKQLSEDEKLEIILHNIRPCYASTLASVTEIKSIEQLRVLCKNYENIQARLKQFNEPSSDKNNLLAPEFAYKPPVFQEPRQSKTQPNNYTFKQSSQNKPFTTNSRYQYRANFPQTPNTKTINTVGQQTFTRSNKSTYCFKCKNSTHATYHCTKPGLVCYKCGEPNVITTNCKQCNKNTKN